LWLQAIKGKQVLVKLNSGVDYRGMCRAHADATHKYLKRLQMPAFAAGASFAGILACLDGYMNIAMEQTEVG
jgi:small nuclear ribonucleoprotein (snRNP)-like protein